MRTPAAVAATALVAASLVTSTVPSYAATSSADTCFGLVPTIVGTPGGVVTGTAGPDVVITNSARGVDTLEGADSVCLTGTTISVDTGPGDDRVDDTGSRYGGSVDLGGGSDSYLGDDDGSFVDTGDRADFRAGLPLGVDTVQSGPGRDQVITGSINVSTNADTVQVGAGIDEVLVRGSVPTSLDGGPGPDLIALDSRVRGDWTVDAPSGVVALDGVAMPAASSFAVWQLDGLSWDSLVFRGGPGKDVVDVIRGNGVVRDGPFSARMGGGKDTVYARSQDSGPFSGGAGEDLLFVEAKGTLEGAPVTADLPEDEIRSSDFESVEIPGFENLSLSNVDGARVIGDRRDNRLSTFGCGNVIDGLAGDDRLSGEASKNCYDAGGFGVTAYGGDGADSLRGGVSRDRLFGGPDFDTADGSSGRDVCVAERRIRCEL